MTRREKLIDQANVLRAGQEYRIVSEHGGSNGARFMFETVHEGLSDGSTSIHPITMRHHVVRGKTYADRITQERMHIDQVVSKSHTVVSPVDLIIAPKMPGKAIDLLGFHLKKDDSVLVATRDWDKSFIDEGTVTQEYTVGGGLIPDMIRVLTYSDGGFRKYSARRKTSIILHPSLWSSRLVEMGISISTTPTAPTKIDVAAKLAQIKELMAEIENAI